MKKFAHQVGDILAAVADVIQPRSFEEFKTYGLLDLTCQDDKI
jgi:hypothetical protein